MLELAVFTEQDWNAFSGVTETEECPALIDSGIGVDGLMGVGIVELSRISFYVTKNREGDMACWQKVLRYKDAKAVAEMLPRQLQSRALLALGFVKILDE